MREIKFRARVRTIHNAGKTYETYTYRWVYYEPMHGLPELPQGDYVMHGQVDMQYTGLKDENGVEIYEGDKTTMVENFDDEGVYAECGTIVWKAKRCCFLWDYQNKHNEFWMLDEACPFEVIGNIHEETKNE